MISLFMKYFLRILFLFIVVVMPYLPQEYLFCWKIPCSLVLLIIGVFCGVTIIWLMGYKNQFPNRFSWSWITAILTEILSKLLTFALYCYHFKLAFMGTKESILGISIWFPRILMFLYYFKMFSVIEIVTLKFLNILGCCYGKDFLIHIATLGIPIGLSITMTTTFMTGVEDNEKYKQYVGFSVIFMFVIIVCYCLLLLFVIVLLSSIMFVIVLLSSVMSVIVLLSSIMFVIVLLSSIMCVIVLLSSIMSVIVLLSSIMTVIVLLSSIMFVIVLLSSIMFAIVLLSSIMFVIVLLSSIMFVIVLLSSIMFVIVLLSSVMSVIVLLSSIMFIVLLSSVMKTVVVKVRFKKEINKEDEFSDNCFLLLFSVLTFQAVNSLLLLSLIQLLDSISFTLEKWLGGSGLLLPVMG